jgi:hypothetical protein
MKKLLILIIALSATQAYAAENETIGEDGQIIEYESFSCTDEEVEAFIKNEDQGSVTAFSGFKEAFKDVKKEEEAKKGSGPGGCLLIFDTYELPTLPDEFFSFSPEELQKIPVLIAKAAAAAIKEGFCAVASPEFIKEQANDALEYYAERENIQKYGITKLHDPWLPQVMQRELSHHLENTKVLGETINDTEGAAEVILFDGPEKNDPLDDYFEGVADDFLDENMIEN